MKIFAQMLVLGLFIVSNFVNAQQTQGLPDNEELFDNKEHSVLAHQRYRGPKNLVVIPDIAHYGIYREAWQRANQLALDWFEQHLQ